MILLLSPAKSLDFSPSEVKDHTMPRLLDCSSELVTTLRKKTKSDLKKLMHVSDNIAGLNYLRFRQFNPDFNLENAKQAILAFNGDVYLGLEAATFNKRDLNFAQKHLRILSGLYGVLKPMDLIQPYRLEMGTKLKTRSFKNLYDYWDDRITQLLNEDLATAKDKIILNLASQEYFKSVKTAALNGAVVNVHFKEERNGVLKVISFNAKKARGAMAQQIIKNRLKKVDDLKQLEVQGYVYMPDLSEERDLVFVK